MIKRDESGKFVSTKEEQTQNVEVNYEDEIKAAEAKLAELKKAQADKVEAEKKAAAEIKRAEAGKVEEAFKNLNAAKKAYNDIVTTAKKVYLETVSQAKTAYNKSIQEVADNLDKADEAYNNALNEFTKAHPEGYHVTLKDGDNTTTISRYDNTNLNMLDTFNDFFDYFFRKF